MGAKPALQRELLKPRILLQKPHDRGSYFSNLRVRGNWENPVVQREC